MLLPFEGSLMNSEENRRLTSGAEGLREAAHRRMVLEAVPLAFSRARGLIFSFGDTRGYMPFAECAAGLELPGAREVAAASRVGRPVCFVIDGFDDGGAALLSRRAVQQEHERAALRGLLPGDVISCRITHIAPFGAFADVGRGVAALLPLESISVSRIRSAADRLAPGDELAVAVRSRDALGRLTLTLKELLGTWEQNAARIRAGETREGIIRRRESYGVFVELTPNLSGLAERDDSVAEDTRALVYVKSIIPRKMKVKLTLLEANGRPARAGLPERVFTGKHIARFRYSPECCERVIETVFD